MPRTNPYRTSYCFCLAATVLMVPMHTAAQSFKDVLVQAPTVPQPERGSVVGSLSKLSFGPGDLPRGTFGLQSPLDLPKGRGGILASIFPSYSPEIGISEWGVGWQGELAIVRHRSVGDIDYITDEYTSPWGRLAAGDDGYWYPMGLSQRIRLHKDVTQWVATLPDGTTQRFTQRVDTPLGTYAWYLTEVRTVHGDQTLLSYEKNSSGRPFLTQVEYGGRAQTDAYRVELGYENLTHPFVSHRAGRAYGA